MYLNKRSASLSATERVLQYAVKNKYFLLACFFTAALLGQNSLRARTCIVILISEDSR